MHPTSASIALAVALCAVAGGPARAADAPGALAELARIQGDASRLRLLCRKAGRPVAGLLVDLGAGTVNGAAFRAESNALRWAARDGAPGRTEPDRALQIDGLVYVGPVFGRDVETLECEASTARPANLIDAP